MIVGITELYHDYNPKTYFLEADALNSENPVDQAVLAAIEAKKDLAFVDASKLEEPQISLGAKRLVGPAHLLIILKVQFD